MCARTAIAPVERVKIIFQISRSKGKSGPAASQMAVNTSFSSIVRRIIAEEGVLELWKGNSAAVVRAVPYMAIQMWANDMCKEQLKPAVSSPTLVNLASGSCAGLCAVALTYPLDTVRARLAAQHAGVATTHYKGMLDALIRLPKQAGIGALYKGMGATLTGAAPYTALKFATYEALKNLVSQHYGLEAGNLPAIFLPICGATAGALAQSFVYPFDVVRRRFQTSDHQVYKGTFDALRTIAREEGIQRGLFRGLSLNYLKTIPNVAIYMSLYDVLKRWMQC